ncbi:hypothetical protein B0T13DRAFT_473604 [Neurospora crassa]|nr:hypothetical protein B0T13DRAFT_473604 [Neurospora crassa]
MVPTCRYLPVILSPHIYLTLPIYLSAYPSCLRYTYTYIFPFLSFPFLSFPSSIHLSCLFCLSVCLFVTCPFLLLLLLLLLLSVSLPSVSSVLSLSLSSSSSLPTELKPTHPLTIHRFLKIGN